MGLSRIGSMSFAGVEITNLDFNLKTPKLVSVDRPSTPNMLYSEFTAPYRHGSRYYDNRYEDLEIKVIIGIYGEVKERQNTITSLLQQWLGKEDKLIFGDRPNLFYKARFYKSVPSKDQGVCTEITITFIASYCMYELYDDLRDYTVDELIMTVDSIGTLVCRAVWQGITGYTTKSITNSGNFGAQPLIEINGTATLLTIEVNNVAFSLSSIDTTIYIDCENMNVYKINNNKKISVLPQFKGGFPTIPPGKSTVFINGTDLNIDLTIDFKNTYIV